MPFAVSPRTSRPSRRPTPPVPPSLAPLDQALHDAMVQRDLEGMRRALQQGANPHAVEGDTPLWFQCTQFRTPGMLKTFLDAGADPNDRFERPNRSQGMSLLLATAYQGSLEEFNLALARGGDPHALAQNHQGVVLCAVFNGKPEVLARAVQVAPEQVLPDVDRDHPLAMKGTPLKLAIETNAPQAAALVEHLLDAGANPHERVGDQSLVEFAQQRSSPATVAVLERWLLREQANRDDAPSPRARARL